MLAYSAVRADFASSKTDPKILSYLAQRGIDVELAIRLQLKILPAQELISTARSAPSAWQGLEDSRLAVVFPHFSIRGELLEWWSARLVSGTQTQAPRSNIHSFTSYVDPDITPPSLGGKMFCPPNEPPAAYLPQGADLPDWHNIPRGARVYIHESVIKSVNGAKLGAYSIGLNGVWGWGSKKHGIQLVDALKDLPWKALELNPIILFDTNVETNQQVEHAAIQLASRLQQITGRTARLLVMHREANQEDFGFDDYAQSVGPDLARQFLDTPDEDLTDIDVSDMELIKRQLSEEFCVLTRTGRVGRIADATLYTADTFANVVCADRTVVVDTPAGGTKELNVPKQWIKDPRRTTVLDLTYVPTHPSQASRIVSIGGCRYLNRWVGWGLPEASPASPEPWLLMLANNIKSSNLMEWLLDWLAYPLQNPGAKLHSYPLIYGEPGTGKDRLFAPIYLIYGVNAVKISSKDLSSNFNSLYAERQFVQADEIKSHHFTADTINQVIKGIVTDETVTVNRKNQEEYVIPNVRNFAITSNYVESVKLDEGDRRATVIHWSWEAAHGMDYRHDSEYWTRYSDWVDHGGAAAVWHYLLTRDLSKFNPKGWAFDTEEKSEVIAAGRTALDGFVWRLRHDTEMELPPLCGARQLFTSKELATMHYEGADYTKGHLDALGRFLKNNGFVQANGGKPLRPRPGIQDRYWVIPREGFPKVDFQVSANCLSHLKAHL